MKKKSWVLGWVIFLDQPGKFRAPGHLNNKFMYNIEPPHDETNKMACAPSEDSDQPGHPSSLIRVFAVHPVGS